MQPLSIPIRRSGVEDQAEGIAALQRGDIRGLATLVKLHQLKALRAAFGILGSRSAADDAVSDAFIKVFEKIRTFDQSRPFEPWLYRLVVNTAIDHSRLARRETPFAEVLLETAGTGDFDIRLEVATAVGTLPTQERAVIVLRYYLDFDEKSICEILQTPLGTIKSRLHRARERLRPQLSQPNECWVLSPAEGV
jgi:RNA polymerase sigma-70 factor (ECF subfamily)